MEKTILCTIDFSESSKDAVKYALNLSRQYHAHITLLYTYRLTAQNGDLVDIRKRMEEQAKQSFLQLEKEVLVESGVSYDFKIEVGFVSNRVREFAKKNDVSFLVMGNKMNSSTKESFDELAENLHMPLVIVP